MTRYFYNISPGVVRMSVPMPPLALVFVSLSLAAMMAFAGLARLIGGFLLIVPAIWLWSQAPRVLLHWSVSGDVFNGDEAVMVHRLELTDGDGLAPFRFSEAPDAPPCGLEMCLYPSFGGLNVETTGKADAGKDETEEATSDLAICISGADFPGADLKFTWADVKEAGGVTVYSKDGAPTVVQI